MARSKKRRSRRKKRSRTHEHEGWHAWWNRQTSRKQHAICIAVLIAVSLGFFAPIHFTGQSLVGGDTVQWRAMAESMISYQEATGRQALWAPNAFAGMPGYMIEYSNQIPQLDDIPRLLRQVIWPSSHFIFLLLGTYLLVVMLSGNLWAGVLAACAFGLTTYIPIILTAGHNTKFIALAFAPWLVLAFGHVLRRPRLLSGLLFAVALAVNLRAEHVQITYYVTFVLGIWWLFEAVSAIRDGRLAAFGKVTGYLALGSVLGLFLVAQPYLVHSEYRDYTIRGSGEGGQPAGLDLGYAMEWSQGVGEMLTLAVADAYGGSSREGTYWGPKPFTEGPHYVGGIVLLLAGLALFLVRRRFVWAFGTGVMVMSLFALGRHFLALNEFMYHYFPLFDNFRVPETWLSIVALALAVLAGVGLAEIGKKLPDRKADERRQKTIYTGFGIAVGAIFLLWVSGGALLDFQKPGERQQFVQRLMQQRPDLSPQDPQVQAVIDQELARLQDERADMFARDARRTLLFLILAGGLFMLYRREHIPAWTMQALIVLLVLVDLWGVDRRHLSSEHLAPTRNAVDQIQQYDFDRFLLERREEAGGAGHFRMVSFAQGNPMTNARPAFYHETLGGYHGAKLRRFQDYIDYLFRDPETGMPNLNALSLMNTRYVVAGGELPGTEVVYEGEQTGMVVSEVPDALPRGFFVGETEVIESHEETWERLLSDDFDPGQTAILPENYDVETTPITEEGQTEAELLSHSPREIVWDVSTDAPRLFVASEVYYPEGWHAYIDGEEVPIRRVNYLLRGVQVPEGDFELEMRFEPASHYLSVWISGVSVLLVYGGVIVLLGLRTRRRIYYGDAEEMTEEAA